MVVTFLAIGSNLGDRESYLKKAIQSLRIHGVEITRCAAIYQTEPKDVGDQPWFLNTVVQANTIFAPRRLLEVCLQVERDNQRIRNEPKAPRTLDIDIVFYGDLVIHEPGLDIPHPRFRARKFVLVPLAEIAGDYTDPETGESVSSLLRQTTDTSQIRLASDATRNGELI